MASRSIEDLASSVRESCLRFQALALSSGLDVLIYCTLRSNEDQARAYSIGRAKPGRIITMARPGESSHNPDSQGKAWAFDAVPMVCGKPAWDDDLLLGLMGSCGERAGLLWAGRWRGALREMVHFELRRGSS